METGMWRGSLIIILVASCADAQIPAPQLQISARILKSGSLSLPPSPGILPVESVTGRVSPQIRVRVRPLSSSPVITIPLIARSNSAYRLIVKSATDLGLEGSEPLRVAIRSVDANAGGAHLMPEATNVLVVPGDLTGPTDQIVVGSGPRISRAGNDSTADNAIRLAFDIKLPHNTPEAELIFMMEFTEE